MELLLFIVPGIGVVGLLLIWIGKMGERHLVKDGEFIGNYIDFMDSGRARGMSYVDSMNEWEIRTAMAKLRRVASEQIAADLPNWKATLDRCCEEALVELKGIDPKLIPDFMRTIGGLSYGHILYPTEAGMVDRYCAGSSKASAPSLDRRAALRIVRAG